MEKFCKFLFLEIGKIGNPGSGTEHWIGASFEGMAYTFGFSIKRAENPESFIKFGGGIRHQKGKKHLENDLSATFWTHRN